MDKEEYLYETGEVYYVDFPYEEKDGKSKQRPVLVRLEKNDEGNIKRAKIKSSIDGAKIQATEEIVKIIKPKTRGLVLP